jgi:hypothetical protein
MVVTPGAGRIEIAGPYAEASIAGGRFLRPVAAGGDSKPLGDHDGAEVATADTAGGQEPVILVDILGAAIRRAGSEELGHPVARCAATGPGLTVICHAILRELGGVEAEKANAIVTQPEAVAIAGTGKAGNRRRRAIQGGRDHGQNGQHRYGQDGSTRTPKDGIAPASSLQDFTTR